LGLKIFFIFQDFFVDNASAGGGKLYNGVGFAGRKPAISWKRLEMGWVAPENKSNGGNNICARTSTNHVIFTLIGG